MLTTSRSETPFFGLVRELKDETQSLIQEEIRLAKTEMSEKMSCMMRNAVSIATGGFVAYAGVIILLLGLGAVIGHFLERAGLPSHVAFAIGWGGMGLVIAAIGGIMIMNAIKTFSQSSLAPEKTIETIHELKGDYAQYRAAREREKIETPENNHKRSSQEIKASVETTQKMMGETMEEIKNRLTPRYMGKAFVAGVKHHPARSAAIGAVTGLLGFLIVRTKMHHNHAHQFARHARKHLPWKWRLRAAHR